MRKGLVVLWAAILMSWLGVAPTAATYVLPVDSYATYQPQKKCARVDKPGTVAMTEWLVARGGAFGGTLRPCSSGGASEHKDGARQR